MSDEIDYMAVALRQAMRLGMQSFRMQRQEDGTWSVSRDEGLPSYIGRVTRYPEEAVFACLWRGEYPQQPTPLERHREACERLNKAITGYLARVG